MSFLAGSPLPLPLACSGHILIDLPIFMGPVVVLAGWLLLMTRRARKRERLEGAGPAPARAQNPQAREPRIGENLLGVQA
jgi:hypothetical protein